MIIELDLDENTDKDVIILHACFKILEDFLTKEVPEYEAATGFTVDTSAFIPLLEWWKNRPNTSCNMEEDTAKLIELMQVRTRLWT